MFGWTAAAAVALRCMGCQPRTLHACCTRAHCSKSHTPHIPGDLPTMWTMKDEYRQTCAGRPSPPPRIHYVWLLSCILQTSSFTFDLCLRLQAARCYGARQAAFPASSSVWRDQRMRAIIDNNARHQRGHRHLAASYLCDLAPHITSYACHKAFVSGVA